MSNVPALNAQYKQINGLNIAWASNTTLTVSAGQTRDSLDQNDIVIGSSLTINGAVNGALGLDTGTLAASTTYAVYAVGSSMNLLTPTVIISANATTPIMPTGNVGGILYTYDTFQRIGWIITDGSTHFLKFYQSGNGLLRNYQYDVPQSLLSGGTSTTFAAVSLATFAPLVAQLPVYLNLSYTPNTAGNTFSVRPTGSTATAANCPIVLSGVVASKAQDFAGVKLITLLSSGNPSVDYLVQSSDALTITLAGYDDYIV